MTIKKAIKIRTVLLSMILIMSAFGQMANETTMKVILAVIVSLVAAIIFVSIKYIKCTKCGTHFGLRFPVYAEHCPFCGEKLQ